MQIETNPESGGRRITGDKARDGVRAPLFTVVTVVFNGAKDLERTIQSVLQQRFSDFEYIIIDGGSSDGTLDLIRKYDSRIDLWLSGPDRGVYDAFNKAARLIEGTWTIFLGAGDVFYNSEALGLIAEAAYKVDANAELIYGKVAILDRDQRLTKTLNRPWSEMKDRWFGGRPMLPHHQGVFHHRKLLATQEPFDIRYRIAADSKLLYASMQRTLPIFSDVAVSAVQLGGLSTTPKYFLVTANEILRINREFQFGRYKLQLWFYMKVIAKYAIFKFAGDAASKFCIDKFRQMTGREAKWAR